MKYFPSRLEQYISTLPKDLQIEALKVIKQEHDRFEREDYTDEEKIFFDRVNKLAISASKTRDKIILDCLRN